MRKTISIVSCLLLVIFIVGCKSDDYAKTLIQQDTSYGRLGMALTGSADQLIQQGRIDAHQIITTDDGTDVDVWVIRRKPTVESDFGKGAAILLHGLLETKASMLSLGESLANKGFDVVIPDLRAHGKSGGKYVTFGAKEKYDIRAVVDQLEKQELIDGPIYVFGFSLGGSVAIQYAAIDSRCKGVIAMAPYKDFEDIARRTYPLMSQKDLADTIARAGEIGGFDPREASTIDAAGQRTCPLLLVYGLLDTTVPVRTVFDAASEPKQLVIIPWGLHATLPIGSEGWIVEQVSALATTGLKEKVKPPILP